MLDLTSLELKIIKVGLQTLGNIFAGSSATRELQQKIDSELRAKGGSSEPCHECGGTGINPQHNEAHPCSCTQNNKESYHITDPRVKAAIEKSLIDSVNDNFSPDYLRIKPDRKNGRDNQ